jgi:release factor glutamine methyltransferase
MKSLRDLVRSATDRLKSAGIESARWDAERLVAHRTGQSRLSLYVHPERTVPAVEEKGLWEAVDRRSRHEPLQYLLGRQEFWGLSFRVGPEVLIPRPETEWVMEEAIAFFSAGTQESAPVIADIGTGSGCLAVSLAREFPGARIFATDLSSGALAVAARNAADNGVDDRIEFQRGYLCEPLFRAGFEGRVRLLVSNPPYIPSDAMRALQPEVRDFEPRLALDGGADGLEIYRRLLPGCGELLAAGGAVILELGDNQSETVGDLAIRSGLAVRRIVPDGAGIPRVLVATKT